MAITDDYVIAGASGDNLDCDDTGGWQTSGVANSPTSNTSNYIEGTASLGLQTSDTGDASWYHDLTSGSRFVITQKDLGIWFYYIKGKGNNFLTQDGTAIQIRLYFGGTSKYADYRLTQTGDLELKFGWQMLMCSGSELNGGSVGGGHNGTTDFDLEVYRFELKLNVATKIDVDLGLDSIFVGTKLITDDGTVSTPATFTELAEYAHVSRPNFPIGVIDVVYNLVNIKCGIDVTGGYLASENEYLLFNQQSKEVKHHLTITNGTFRVGKNESNQYAILGGTLAKPLGKSADIVVSGGSFEVYNSKFFRWSDIKFNSTTTLNSVDFDSNDTIFFSSTNVDIEEVTIHDSVDILRDNSLQFDANPSRSLNINVYNCTDGCRFTNDVTLVGFDIKDITNHDVWVDDLYTIHLKDSKFNTMKRV
jgi:hypothetical protein